MIAKSHTVQNTAAALKYCEKEKAEQIFTQKVYGNASKIADQMKTFQDQNTRAENKGYHAILSFSKNDEKVLTKEIKEDLIKEYLKAHGLQDNQAVAYEHKDTEHLHIHIVANRIKVDGRCVSNSNERYKNMSFVRAMSYKHGLENSKNVGGNTQKERFKAIIDSTVNGSKSFSDVERELKEQGFSILKGTGVKQNGITFIDDKSGVQFKASSLGNRFTYNSIEKRLKGGYRQNEKKDFSKKVDSSKNTKDVVVKIKLRNAIVKALGCSDDFTAFRLELKKQGVSMVKSRGISFIDDKSGKQMKGSDVGREFSLENLMKQLGNSKEEQNNAVNVSVSDGQQRPVEEKQEVQSQPGQSEGNGTIKAPKISSSDEDDEDLSSKKRKRNKSI